MASSEHSTDFKERVAKIFGSLAPSQSPLNQQQREQQQRPSLWSLTDDQVQRREWRRKKTDEDDDDDDEEEEDTPCSATSSREDRRRRRTRNWRKQFQDDPDDLDDDDDGSETSRDGDEWEIRASIGMDPTLDREDEEDEFDTVASGKGYAHDRVYMSDITGEGSYLNSRNVLSGQLYCNTKDQRANRYAAKIRLKEDDAEAKRFNTSDIGNGELQKPQTRSLLKSSGTENNEESRSQKRVEFDPAKINSSDVGNAEVEKPQPRSILKRKGTENNEESRSQKRVKFDPGCVNHGIGESTANFQDSSTATPSVNATVSLQAQYASGVPDYVQNPSRYTRYSFDSTSDIDTKSNTQAFMNFLKLVKRSDPMESGTELEGASAELPKSVTFIPKKKASDVQALDNNSETKKNIEDNGRQTLKQAGFPVGLAAREAQHSDDSAMEEDEPETDASEKNAGLQKPGRRYRTKSRSDDSDSG